MATQFDTFDESRMHGFRESVCHARGYAKSGARTFRVTITDNTGPAGTPGNPIWYIPYDGASLPVTLDYFKLTVQAVKGNGDDDTTYVPTINGVDVTFTGPYSSFNFHEVPSVTNITWTGWSGGHKTVLVSVSDSAYTATTTSDCEITATDNYATPPIIGIAPIVMVPTYVLNDNWGREEEFTAAGQWPNSPSSVIIIGGTAQNGKAHLSSPNRGYARRSILYAGASGSNPACWPTYPVVSATLDEGIFTKYESGEDPTPPGFEALNFYNCVTGALDDTGTYETTGLDLLGSIPSSTADSSQPTVDLDAGVINAASGQPARLLRATQTEVDGGGLNPVTNVVQSWAAFAGRIHVVLRT